MAKKTAVKRARSESVEGKEELLHLPHSTLKTVASLPQEKKNQKSLKIISKKFAKKATKQKPPPEKESSTIPNKQGVGYPSPFLPFPWAAPCGSNAMRCSSSCKKTSDSYGKAPARPFPPPRPRRIATREKSRGGPPAWRWKKNCKGS